MRRLVPAQIHLWPAHRATDLENSTLLTHAQLPSQCVAAAAMRDIGSFQATITFSNRSFFAWIDVHNWVLTPLLSCEQLKLSLISTDFPKAILEVKHANRVHDTSSDENGFTTGTTPEADPGAGCSKV